MQLLFWVIPVDETVKTDFPTALSRHWRSHDRFRNRGVFLGFPALPEIPFPSAPRWVVNHWKEPRGLLPVSLGKAPLDQGLKEVLEA